MSFDPETDTNGLVLLLVVTCSLLGIVVALALIFQGPATP